MRVYPRIEWHKPVNEMMQLSCERLDRMVTGTSKSPGDLDFSSERFSLQT